MKIPQVFGKVASLSFAFLYRRFFHTRWKIEVGCPAFLFLALDLSTVSKSLFVLRKIILKFEFSSSISIVRRIFPRFEEETTTSTFHEHRNRKFSLWSFRSDRMGKFFPPQLRIFWKDSNKFKFRTALTEWKKGITSENSLRFRTRREKKYIYIYLT